MISPHTPPGTEVVALVDMQSTKGVMRVARGRIYTVAQIVQLAPGEGEEFGVVMQEHGEVRNSERPGFLLCCRLSWFRPLDLGGLDALLDVSEKEPAGAPV